MTSRSTADLGAGCGDPCAGEALALEAGAGVLDQGNPRWVCAGSIAARCRARHQPCQAEAWVGDGGWNLNRWEPRGAVPAVTKEQLDKLKLKY